MRKLQELVEIRSGYTFRSSVESFEPGDTEVIQAKDLGEFFGMVSLPKVAYKGNADHLLQPGDVLISARGFVKARVYRSGNMKAIASSSIFVLRPRFSNVNSEFLAMFFNSLPGIKAVFGLSSGASVQAITKESLGQILIPELPPDMEQALGRLVQSVDDYREKLHEKEIYMDNLRSTIISKTLREAAK